MRLPFPPSLHRPAYFGRCFLVSAIESFRHLAVTLNGCHPSLFVMWPPPFLFFLCPRPGCKFIFFSPIHCNDLTHPFLSPFVVVFVAVSQSGDLEPHVDVPLPFPSPAVLHPCTFPSLGLTSCPRCAGHPPSLTYFPMAATVWRGIDSPLLDSATNTIPPPDVTHEDFVARSLCPFLSLSLIAAQNIPGLPAVS